MTDEAVHTTLLPIQYFLNTSVVFQARKKSKQTEDISRTYTILKKIMINHVVESQLRHLCRVARVEDQ